MLLLLFGLVNVGLFMAIFVPVSQRLLGPRRVNRIAAAAESGRLGLNVRLFADERDRRQVTALLQQGSRYQDTRSVRPARDALQ